MKNFRYVEKTSAECNEDSYLAILHLSRVELHCKLQEKLHRVTWPLGIGEQFTQNLGSGHYLWGGREWLILRRSYKILKVAEGGVMLILDLKKKGLLENSLRAVLINN